MSRNDEVDRTWPGPPCMSTCKTIRSDVVLARRPPTLCCSRAVARYNDEVRKTDASHCGKQ